MANKLLDQLWEETNQIEATPTKDVSLDDLWKSSQNTHPAEILKESMPEKRVGFWGSVPESAYQQGERNIMGNIFERPGAAVRSALQGKGYVQGAINPTNVPTFQNQLLDAYYQKTPNFPGKVSLGNIPSAIGMGADIATNPADLALMLAGKVPGVKEATKFLGNTKPFQALNRFLTKERRFLKFGKDAVLNVSKKGVTGLDKLDIEAGKKYEAGIQSIEGTQKNLKPISDSIDDVVGTFPEVKFTKLEQVQERINNLGELNAIQLRDLKQELKKGIPQGVFSGKTDPTAIQAAQLRVYNAVDDALVDLGGDKYKLMKREYTEWKNIASDSYKVLLEEGRPGDVNLRQWFGYGLSRRKTKSLEAVNKMLPSREQFMQEFYAWRRGQMLKGAGAAAIPLTYLLHRKIADKTIKGR